MKKLEPEKKVRIIEYPDNRGPDNRGPDNRGPTVFSL